MSVITQTQQPATAPYQSLHTVAKPKDLEALTGAIVAYVTTDGPLSSSLYDLSFGFLTKASFRDGTEGYRMEGILRGKEDLLLVDDWGWTANSRLLESETDLTTYTQQGPIPSYSEPRPSRTYRIAVQMGIASPAALQHLEEQLNTNAHVYQFNKEEDKRKYPNCSVVRSPVYDADSTRVAGVSFREAVGMTLEKQRLSVDAPKPVEPSSTTDGKQE